MCTIIVRHQIDDFCSTIIAANRDEFYQRSATGPQVLSDAPLVVGGRDEEKGGTWLGVTPGGLFMGLTNQRNWGFADPSLRSRGAMVVEALKTGSIDSVKSFLGDLRPQDYNEFNVVFGEGEELWAGYSRHRDDRLILERLGTDAYVLCNDRLGSAEFPKAQRVRARVRGFSRTPWPKLREGLVDALKDHETPPPDKVPQPPEGALFDHEIACRLQSPCVHTPHYGTVSSAVIVLRPGKVVEYLAAQGPPCENQFEDFTHLLA